MRDVSHLLPNSMIDLLGDDIDNAGADVTQLFLHDDGETYFAAAIHPETGKILLVECISIPSEA